MSDESSNIPNSEQFDEQLVAYLDGELEPQAARQVENMLATEPQAQQRLNQLAASWDLLDQLPRATVDDLFTRTTVEMVALAAEDEVTQAKRADPAKRRRRWLEGGIAALAAATVGFVIVAMTLPDQNDALLRDLPVVKNLELYRDVGDLDLLKQLQKANLFTEDASSSTPVSKNSASDNHPTNGAGAASSAIPSSLEERRAWVASLDPAQKIALRDELERFSALPPNQQLALRKLDEQLSADKNSDSLRRIMQRYYDWLKTLTPTDRFTVVDESAAVPDRMKAISNLRQREVQQALAMLDPTQMLFKDHDNAAVLRWMREFADIHEADLLSSSADSKRPETQKSDDRRRRRPVALSLQEWWGPSATSMPPVTATDIHSLQALLSPEKQQELDAQASLPDQIQLIRKWIQHAGELAVVNFGRNRNLPNAERLKQFEEQQLSADEKKELAALPPAERSRKLMELWNKHRGTDATRFGGSAGRQPGDSPATGAQKSSDHENAEPPSD
ncbi:MAG TPA: hypothetical protein VFE46_03995 [Pirellulales bacterium]|jgi:hypothetical protein|nr:hypothetical protein [Pirellulales bacterium]